jgi:two-component sensor histidine kinase
VSAQLETEKLRRQVSTLAAFGGQALRAQDVGELLPGRPQSPPKRGELLPGEKGPFGVLEVDSRQRRSFGQDDIDFLQNYANLLASAVDRLDRQQELEQGMKSQQFLFNELQHRVNNMLTTIRAVARRTRAHSPNLDQFAKALDDRLSALARIHNLFSHPGKMAATMREILTQELSAQGAVEGNNFVQRGPDIAFPAREAELLSLAFHELATNAVKHGALSAKDGRICITWVINRAENGEHVLVRWRERGVSIEQPPTRRRFGSELLEKSIFDLPCGHFDRTFHPDGIECALEFRIGINVPAASQRFAMAIPELAREQQ